VRMGSVSSAIGPIRTHTSLTRGDAERLARPTNLPDVARANAGCDPRHGSAHRGRRLLKGRSAGSPTALG
jgi:hypothetical protein